MVCEQSDKETLDVWLPLLSSKRMKAVSWSLQYVNIRWSVLEFESKQIVAQFSCWTNTHAYIG